MKFVFDMMAPFVIREPVYYTKLYVFSSHFKRQWLFDGAGSVHYLQVLRTNPDAGQELIELLSMHSPGLVSDQRKKTVAMQIDSFCEALETDRKTQTDRRRPDYD